MKLYKKYILNNFKTLLYKIEYRRRVKINNKNGLLRIFKENEILKSFNQFQSVLNGIKYPNNDFNKIMSLVLSDLDEYIFIIWRFIHNRKQLQVIAKQDQYFRILGANQKTFPQHPLEKENANSLKIDVKSLFLYGVITVNKSLLLIEKYLPDAANEQYTSISKFYDFLINKKTLKSSLCENLKDELFEEIKFFRGPLSIFRNKFIQHITRGYQTGFTHGWSNNDFELNFYAWDIDTDMQTKIALFKNKLSPYNIDIFNINDDRKLLQTIFDNIEKVPDELVSDVANLITYTGVSSLHPYKLITNIENYYIKLFRFFIDNLSESELIKYKTK